MMGASIVRIVSPRAGVALASLAVAAFAALLFAGVAAAAYVPTGSFSGGPGSANGELDAPGRAAVEQATGNLFVVDSGNDRVQVFESTGPGAGAYLTQFGASELSEPWGIAIDENAGQTFVYVADAGNDRIVKYASDEQDPPSFSVDGSFSLAPGHVEDFRAALAVDPTHDLLVADPEDDEVERFSSNGVFETAFDGAAGPDSPGAFTVLLDVAVNSAGDIYVIDATHPNIAEPEGTSKALRYSGSGQYKARLMPLGPRNRPATIPVDRSDDTVYVSGDQDAIFDN